jgi:hypothetical protein
MKKCELKEFKMFNLRIPAQNVKNLLQQSLLCISEPYLFSTFLYAKNTSKFLSTTGRGPSFNKQRGLIHS